jgi:hypothetical protein
MFQALLAHPQEVLHKWHLVYCVRIMSVGCGTVAVHVSSITCSSSGGATQMAFGILCAYNVSWLWHGCSEAAVSLQLFHSQLTYARNIPNAVRAAPTEDGQVMLKTCRGP